MYVLGKEHMSHLLHIVSHVTEALERYIIRADPVVGLVEQEPQPAGHLFMALCVFSLLECR